MASREYLQITQETAYGTTPVKVVGTNSFYCRLHEDDIFTGQENPVPLDIPYGGGRTTPAQTVHDQKVCLFAFKTYMYPGEMLNTLCDWAMTPINTGRTAPWTTTDSAGVMPVGDLPSLTFGHGFEYSDGTVLELEYTGAKCLTWSVAASRQDPRFVFTCTGQAIKQNSVNITPPTETQYPDGMYLFSHTGGNLIIADSGSTARTMYDAITLSGQNTMDPNWFESTYVQLIKFCGRTVTMDVNLLLKPSPDDLALFQAQTDLTVSLAIDDGTNSLTFDFNDTNYFKSIARNLRVGGVYKRRARLQNFWDRTTGNDFSFTAA